MLFHGISSKFKNRVKEGELTIQESPLDHVCAYFAAYDDKNKSLFIGHHKKSGLWLFNGGHIDGDETIGETIRREIKEEWGIDPGVFEINQPALLTITEINNPIKQTCKRHYDFWHFIKVDMNDFKPDDNKILEEFHEVSWLDAKRARELVKDKNTLIGIDFIENNYF